MCTKQKKEEKQSSFGVGGENAFRKATNKQKDLS